MLNKNINRYYLYTFVKNLAKVRWVGFSMSFFFFMWFPIVSIMGTILVYGLTCLLIMKPIIMLMNKIWEKYTFYMHLIPSLLSFFIIINISLENHILFYLWMFVHAFTIMLSRIPLTAYFTKSLWKWKEWKEISLFNNIESIASVLAPIIFWALIDKTWIIIYVWISLVVNFIAAMILWWKQNEEKKKLNPNLSHYLKILPKRIKKWLFISNLPYPLTQDLLFIWIISILWNFTIAWFVIWIKILFEIALTYIVWRFCDRWKIRNIFYIMIIISSAFWFLVLWIDNPIYASAIQILFGMTNLVIDIPIKYEYHKEAKKSWKEIEFSIAKEIAVQWWIVAGSIPIIFLAYILQDKWHYLFPIWILMPIWYAMIIQKSIKLQ